MAPGRRYIPPLMRSRVRSLKSGDAYCPGFRPAGGGRCVFGFRGGRCVFGFGGGGRVFGLDGCVFGVGGVVAGLFGCLRGGGSRAGFLSTLTGVFSGTSDSTPDCGRFSLFT